LKLVSFFFSSIAIVLFKADRVNLPAVACRYFDSKISCLEIDGELFEIGLTVAKPLSRFSSASRKRILGSDLNRKLLKENFKSLTNYSSPFDCAQSAFD